MKIPQTLAGLSALLLGASFASAQQPAPQSEAVVRLNPFTVEAERNRGYQAANVQSASKLALPIKDVAQTVTVLTSDFLKDISASNLAEALSYVPGVVANGGARNQDGFTIRGFNQPLTYLDGFRDGQEWASGENAHVAQLEILKGPASNLYGNGRGFGGVINRVTKKPQATPYQAAEVTIGSENFFRFTYDTTGPISADKSLLYRVNAAFTNDGLFRDGIDLKRYFVSPVIAKRMGATEVTLYLEFLRTETREDLGIPSILDTTRPVGFQRVAPAIPRSRNFGESWEETILEKQSARLLATHAVNEDWTIRLSANALAFNNPITQIEVVSLAADNRTLNRRGFRLNRWEDHLIGEIDVLGKFETGPLKHNLLIGYEYNREVGRSNVRRAPLGPIDIQTPVYGAALPDFFAPTATVASNLLFQNGIYGAFINDQVSLFDDRLQVFGGVRHDRATSNRKIQLPGGSEVADPANKKAAPRYGAVFKPTADISVYAQYSEAFRPIFGATTPTFDALKPETGILKEVGIKTTWLNGRLGFDVAAYEIQVKDLAIRLDPPNNSFFRNGGVTQGNGTEVNLSYNDERWNLIAGYLNQDVRDVVVQAGVPLGAQGQPKHMADFFGKHTWRDGPLKGFALGAGMVYQGDRPFSNNAGVLESFTRFDLLASYAYSAKLNLALNVRNVLDEEYFFNASGIMLRPAEPLSIRFSARFEF